jgi:TolA-binding protein
VRIVLFLGLLTAATAGWAPLQCRGEPDPSLRKSETPGEALYGLAKKFESEGRHDAWRSTLEHLIDRYPNSRFAVRAADDLESAGFAPPEPAR